MQLDDKLDTQMMCLRILAYGTAKTRKTWWALKAAESNFNIVLLDGDDGWHIASQIKPEFRKRINVLSFVDSLNKATFAPALTDFLKNGQLLWDEVNKKNCKLARNEATTHLQLNQLDRGCILVIDSWTALVASLLFRYAQENSIDLSDPEKSDREYYAWAGSLATWMLKQLRAISQQCHVIVIAHQTMYEKRSADGKKIEWARQQVSSTSGNHALTMATYFSDVLTFSVKGSSFNIDTSGDAEREGGSRLMAPKMYKWDELQFVDLIKAAGQFIPDASNPYLDFTVEEANPAAQAAQKPQPVGGAPIVASKATVKFAINK